MKGKKMVPETYVIFKPQTQLTAREDFVNAGIEVLKALVTKSSVYWDITPCRICGSHGGGYEEFYLLGYNAVYDLRFSQQWL
jgi:hypothetical protein